MGNLRFAAAILFVAACGSDHQATPDAAKIPDAKLIDAKVWMDAPPPSYDFSCYNMTPGTTVAATIDLAGTTGEIGQGGFSGKGPFDLDVYKVGVATSAGTVTSNMTTGAFDFGSITSGGKALEYVRSVDPAGTPTYRTTYLYPPNPVRNSFPNLPVPMIKQSLIATLGQLGTSQDDTNSGLLFIAVHDCNTTTPTPIDGATLKVQQGGQDVGDVIDLGQLAAQAAGTFIVMNVPDNNTTMGVTTVSASFNGMNFPAHTVTVHKKPNSAGAMGTNTVTDVPPGPIN